MDISYSLDMSVSEDGNSFDDSKQLSPDQSQFTCGVVGDVSLNDLGDGLTEFLHIQDGQKSTSNLKSCAHSDKSDINDMEKEEMFEEPCNIKLTSLTSDKHLCKCAIFPPSHEATFIATSKDGGDKNELNEIPTIMLKENSNESATLVSPEPVSLPTPLNIVSAMKGGRKSRGIPPKKLTVTWAPDVYDPPPTSLSHVPSNKKSQQRGGTKKKGKKRRKGKGKQQEDKKQVQKSIGSSKKCLKSAYDGGKLVEYDERYANIVDFDVGNPDSFCGGSFLKKSITNMHFSVAEAV